MWAEASPARKFLRKANYYVVTQAQSVYDILAYNAAPRTSPAYSAAPRRCSDVKEQKSAKKTLSSIAKALHSINKEKILFFARPRSG